MPGPLLPAGMKTWIRAVDEQLGRLRVAARSVTNVPVGGLVLLAANADLPPRWLLANGASFDPETWPELADQLEASVVPTHSNIGSSRWIIRAG